MKVLMKYCSISLILSLFCLTGCNSEDDGEKIEEKNALTSLTLQLNIEQQKAEKGIAVMADYFSIDWGDGTDSQNFTANSAPKKIPHVYEKPGQYTVKVTGNKVTQLLIEENAIDQLTLIRAPYITLLRCYGNRLETLDVTLATALKDLNCSDNRLTTLTVGKHTQLERLVCERNQLKSLDVSSCKKLEYIQVASNPLADLNVSDCENLQSLMINKSRNDTIAKVKSVNVQGCTSLNTLRCDYNDLTALDLTSCVNLERLICHENPNLNKLTLPGNSKVNLVRCDNTLINLISLVNALPNLMSSNTGKLCFDKENASSSLPEQLKQILHNKNWEAVSEYQFPL